MTRATFRPEAVLFDRDGTLIADVPYCADPARVRPVPAARTALRLLRQAGIPTGVVTNQSGIARRLISDDQAHRVNERVEQLLGPFAVWEMCPHGESDRCTCRKPRPGMVLSAAARLGVPPQRVAVIGDIASDVEAARAAGALGVLVPTPATRHDEVAGATVRHDDLVAAVRWLLGGAVTTAGRL